MPGDDKVALKEKVQAFLTDQPLYDPNQQLNVVCDEGGFYFIKYGDDLALGVLGFGNTPEGAFNDFNDNWSMYRAVKSPL